MNMGGGKWLLLHGVDGDEVAWLDWYRGSAAQPLLNRGRTTNPLRHDLVQIH